MGRGGGHVEARSGSRTRPDGRSEGYDGKTLAAAARTLEAMVRSGKIAIRPVSGGAAGAWAPDNSGGGMTGGTFEVGESRSVKEIGRASRNFTAQSQPAVVEAFRSYSFWNGMRPQSLTTPYPYEKPPCGSATEFLARDPALR